MNLKKRLGIITAICVCVLSMTSVFAAGRTTETVNLYRSSYQATSDATKDGMAAKYYANNYTSSLNTIYVYCEAAWKGALWPYTNEASMSLGVGQTGTRTVTQSKTSNFRICLYGGYAKCNTYGEVTVTR